MAEISSKRVVTIDDVTTGSRIDFFLSQNLTEISRTKIQRGIENGLVLINKLVPKKRQVLRTGDIVEISKEMFFDEDSAQVKPQDIDIDIIYEDENYVAINKKAGMVVHPGNGNPDGTLVNALLYHFDTLSNGSAKNRPGIVHRLDKNTSGVIVIAKNDRAHNLLTSLFMNRSIQKTYRAICIGEYPMEKGTIDYPIGRKKNDPVRWCVRNQGKEAVTDFTLLSHYCGISVMQFNPHTGRTHQIRVHASHSGFPIIADNLYGGDKNRITYLEPLDRIFAHKIYNFFSRQALHAKSICFIHPYTHIPVTIEAPYPQDFQQALALFDAR